MVSLVVVSIMLLLLLRSGGGCSSAAACEPCRQAGATAAAQAPQAQQAAADGPWGLGVAEKSRVLPPMVGKRRNLRPVNACKRKSTQKSRRCT